jgi:putative flavoprotein involved in K+ transport
MSIDGSHHTVVVVGGGQAGLAMSAALLRRGIDHLVLERHRVAHEWSTRRWDTFCLVTPNWQCDLPDFPYPGDDPHGFMVRDQIVDYLNGYADSLGPRVCEGVSVSRLRRHGDDGFELRTSAGTLTADQVVVATGPYQVPRVPRAAERLAGSVMSLHSSQYRNPDLLPDGGVLIVGTGQSGCQIAEDLHLSGRQVHLATGTAPRVARRYRGRDVVDWLADMGYYAKTIEEFDDADAIRFRVNHYVTGRDGGRDIDLRAFAREGMRLYGRLRDIEPAGPKGGPTATFGNELRSNLDHADSVSESIKDSIDAWIAARGLGVAPEARYVPVWQPDDDVAEVDLEATGISSVLWSTGFGRDDRWIEVAVFDGRGYPAHRRGVTSCPGLYFLGLPWQWTWGSGRFCGVGEDALHLATRIEEMKHSGVGTAVRWITGPPTRFAADADENWVAPRTVA